jgi:hypothetical protein
MDNQQEALWDGTLTLKVTSVDCTTMNFSKRPHHHESVHGRSEKPNDRTGLVWRSRSVPPDVQATNWVRLPETMTGQRTFSDGSRVDWWHNAYLHRVLSRVEWHIGWLTPGLGRASRPRPSPRRARRPGRRAGPRRRGRRARLSEGLKLTFISDPRLYENEMVLTRVRCGDR